MEKSCFDHLFLFFQHTWKSGGGGAIACYGAQEFGKKNVALPVISGHQGPVMDLNFSPMHDSCLASCSQDGSVKMWMIPEEGI